MYRGRVFIGDGSPTTLRFYTVMPPNNYIPGIFPGYNRIFTLFGKLHPSLFCPLGPLQPIRPRLAHHHSVNKIPFAASEALTLRSIPLLVFDLAIGALVFAVGALVFATLRPKLEALRLIGLLSRQKTLSLHSNCVRSRCPSLEGR